jgi:hypothetical protein
MDPEIWDLIVVGRGSAARYYLTSIEREAFPNILVVGLKDPWGGDRGTDLSAPSNPVNKINQTKGMIFSQNQAEPEFSEEMVDRLAWADETKRIIDRIATKVVDGEVIDAEISESGRVPKFIRASGRMRLCTVKLKSGVTYDAKKIVIATGAGGHQEPAEVRNLTKQFPAFVMNMDEFARKSGTFADPSKLTVFVQGWNAAIDTVDTAKFQKFNVVWLVKEGAEIGMLATPHQVYARDAAKNDVKRYKGAERGKPAFTVRVTPGNAAPVEVVIGSETLKGNYFVYGMGQEPEDAMKGVLPPGLRDKLVPIYDINQRHGPAHATVLGFKLENSDWDNGFEVVGALCTQVARMKGGVKHTYLKELEGRIDEVRKKVLQHLLRLEKVPATSILFESVDKLGKMNTEVARRRLGLALDPAVAMYPTWKNHIVAIQNLLTNYVCAAYAFSNRKTVTDNDLNRITKTLTPSTVAHAQLGGIRAATTSMNGFAKLNPSVSQDDRTMLRADIAYNYPFVSEADAQTIMHDMIEGRSDKKLNGYCYGPDALRGFEERLSLANLSGSVGLRQAKKGGTLPTQSLPVVRLSVR